MDDSRFTYVDGRPLAASTEGVRLLDWLRDAWGRTAPKEGCGAGVCGACTVIVDGRPALACCLLAKTVAGRQVWTAAGLAETESGRSLLEAFARHGAVQCGFCAPGMLTAAFAWLTSRAGQDASAGEAREALAGNVCRCTGYGQIVEAMLDAAGALGRKVS